jgi:two-component system cell cycle sensor histidine kinase/response regulator CckA
MIEVPRLRDSLRSRAGGRTGNFFRPEVAYSMSRCYPKVEPRGRPWEGLAAPACDRVMVGGVPLCNHLTGSMVVKEIPSDAAPPGEKLRIRILHVEDNPLDAELIRRDLQHEGIDAEMILVESRTDFERAFASERFDLVISDYNMPQWDGLEALDLVRAKDPEIPFIFVSGNLGEERAIEAIKRGATDYILKDRMSRMSLAVRRAVLETRERARRRQLEGELIHAQKMEAIGRLAGGVAHDFNNLLTVINGFTELLLGATSPEDPRQTDLKEISNAGRRAASLTRQLLAFSRRQVFQPTTLDLNAILAGIEKMLVRLIGEDIQLILRPAPGLHRVNADAGQIEQSIINLVVNARDAMPQGGRILLETANVELDEAFAALHAGSRTGSHAMLSVTDTGTGISAEAKAHLFEPFFTTKEKGKGTGLGLSTVHGIIRQSGGSIDVSSEPGRGATFRIFLPQSELNLAPSAPVPPVAPLRGTETLLVAEDMETVRRLARTVLEGAGYRVLLAQDGTEALKICEEHEGEIHLLLTDVVMHAISGPELAVLVRRTHPETRILFMSGYSDRSLEELGAPGVDAVFLQKPFTIESLRAKVREALHRPVRGNE